MIQKLIFKSSQQTLHVSRFDPDDRKFIAVALAHSEKPPILQAVDSAWWNYRDALRQNGITIDFICEDDIRLMLNAITPQNTGEIA